MAVSGQEPLPSRCWWKQNKQKNSRREEISSENTRSASILHPSYSRLSDKPHVVSNRLLITATKQHH